MKTLLIQIKPVSSRCDMRCAYCFFADGAGGGRRVADSGRMSPEILESVVFSSMKNRIANALVEQSVLAGSSVIHVTHADIAVNAISFKEDSSIAVTFSSASIVKKNRASNNCGICVSAAGRAKPPSPDCGIFAVASNLQCCLSLAIA